MDVNKSRYRNFARSNKRRLVLDRYKRMKGCVECGFKGHPAALEFDHRDPTDKTRTVASLMYHSWEKIRQEVLKCDIRCANCHQIKSVLDRRAAYLENRSK